VQDGALVVDLKGLVEPATRGDPMQSLLWTTRSLRRLTKELANKGHKFCPTVVGDLLRGMGFRSAGQQQGARGRPASALARR
jgi:hypothetical protein